MNVELRPEHAEYVSRLVETGTVSSPEAAVSVAMALFLAKVERRDAELALDDLISIEEGLRDVEAGRVMTIDECRRRLASQRVSVGDE